MSSPPITRPYTRPPLAVSRPDRRAGGFYRMADAKGRSMGGVPLDSAEAAVVAAVRLGYKVAATQVDRSARLARRLRDAGDRVDGGDSARKGVDATERLVFRSMMAGLTWLEVLAAERGSPFRRLAAAEFQLLGNLFGLTPAEKSEKVEVRGEDRVARDIPPHVVARGAPLRIRLIGDKRARRAVSVVHWEIGKVDHADLFEVFFHQSGGEGAAIIEGNIALRAADGVAELRLETRKDSPSGTWRAAVCTADGVQVGVIEIEL
jgi:hypothetical protein